jgi:hypothetical protein
MKALYLSSGTICPASMRVWLVETLGDPHKRPRSKEMFISCLFMSLIVRGEWIKDNEEEKDLFKTFSIDVNNLAYTFEEFLSVFNKLSKKWQIQDEQSLSTVKSNKDLYDNLLKQTIEYQLKTRQFEQNVLNGFNN